MGDRCAVDRHAGDPLSRRHGRGEPVAGAAVDAVDADLDPAVVEVYRPPRERVLRVSVAARVRSDWRFCRRRPLPVLRVLGSLPGADVLPDWHLGSRPPHLRRGEVLPVHDGGFGADAGRHPLHLQQGRDVRLPGAIADDGERQVHDDAFGRNAAVPGLLPGVRHQSSTVPAAYVVA